MFEDRCLMCGLYLADEGRPYCSDECVNSDMYSPSISSSSSVLSSPQLDYAPGGDVPSLIPSALGSALKNFAGRNTYYMSSSSSASSASWSVFTDEEDQEAKRPCSTNCDYSQHDASEAVLHPNLKNQNFINSVNPSALSYTRVPSCTNNHSLVPQVKHRSRSRRARGFPRSAPIQSRVLSDDDEVSSDAGFSSNDLDSDSEAIAYLGRDDRSVTAKTKRSRNRASLPACFSLLQIASPSKPIRSPPISSSSGNATVRQSPPTPKLPPKSPGSTLHISPTVVPLSALHDTPRGRQRETGHSWCSHRLGNSSYSRSRSQRRRIQADNCPKVPKPSLNGPSVEGLAFPTRGRPAIRRNSSPISKVISDMEDAMSTEIHQIRPMDTQSGSRSRPRPRGRTRVEDLEGVGSSIEAPGYGNGRSGLVYRERGHHSRLPF